MPKKTGFGCIRNKIKKAKKLKIFCDSNRQILLGRFLVNDRISQFIKQSYMIVTHKRKEEIKQKYKEICPQNNKGNYKTEKEAAQAGEKSTK